VYGSRELAAAFVQFRSSSSYSHAPGARDQLFHCRQARGIQFRRGPGSRRSIQAQNTRAKTQGQSTFQGNQTYSHKPLDSKGQVLFLAPRSAGRVGIGRTRREVGGGRGARWSSLDCRRLRESRTPSAIQRRQKTRKRMFFVKSEQCWPQERKKQKSTRGAGGGVKKGKGKRERARRGAMWRVCAEEAEGNVQHG
jgi:hypothetical protein